MPTSPRTLSAIALVSFASLLLELGLTRLFSVVLFYHFAFLAISVALLGLGAGGVFAYIRKQWLERWSVAELGAITSIANSVLIFAVLEVVLHLPISLELTRGNFGKLTVMYLIAAVPFFFTGLLFSVVFARAHSASINTLYAADLGGGALACIAIVPLLNGIGGPNAILFAAVCMALAASLWAETKQWRTIGAVASLAFIVLIAANHSGKLIDIVYAKGMRRDQPWMEFAKWNALSRVEVDQIGEAKNIVIDADASTAIMNVDPARWDTTKSPGDSDVTLSGYDAERSSNPDKSRYNWKRDLMAAAPAIANVLRPHGKFAIIGPGGGVDVLRAVANGSKDVTAIEINPIIATDIMRGRYKDFSYNLYGRPEVHLHVGDGRSFIRNSKERYDVVQMTLVDTWASTAAGAFALSENNLYTVEAFEEYFQHLKPDGFIAITRWEFREPREALRVVVQAGEALRRMGTPASAANFIVVSNGDLTVDGRPVAVLAKKSPFTPEEERAFLGHVVRTQTLNIVATPGVWPLDEKQLAAAGDERMGPVTMRAYSARMSRVKAGDVELVNPFLEYTRGKALLPLAGAVSADQFRSYLIQHYPYDISPVYDRNPFFFFTLKTEDVIRKIAAGTGAGMDWRINLGVTVLFMVLVISIVAVVAFLIAPLALAGKGASTHVVRHTTNNLLYFIFVGLGFILVEIALIQRFVLFLGHPTYALTVVVFLMLLASGAGSFISKRVMSDSARVWIPLVTIAVGIVLYRFALPAIISAGVGLPFAVKLAVSAGLLVPLGLLMGVPFPTGLRALSERNDGRVEWAWALNAAASVLGSVSAMIIAIHFGLNVTLLCGAAAYILAAITRVK
jgi:SAM-dependent methyltransferase